MTATVRPAVVLLSGGMDSATVLAIAREQGFACHALSLHYGQRHSAELDAARKVAAALGAVRHEVVSLDLSHLFHGPHGSALTDTAIDVPTAPAAAGTIPVTYVPARNTIMLSIALGWAEVLGATDIFFGANAVDYSGYPDCRPAYVDAYTTLANLATKAGVEGQGMKVHAPIIDLSKADIVKAGMARGVDFGMTVSCYQADEHGHACGVCDACRLRRQGFIDAGVADPTRYRQA
ncbi:7-cyano-7-deazaguanine synthase QueC [Derxia lacustris]|uniref:7-cyano-7-deazaguanine synthase QueC n=1 Tax=Derxia lacustris TaxID=764842 RepID=UPI000A16DEBB|nr:7-cyano-7-deazaguanine synthase QueC [Derxia lacustris]